MIRILNVSIALAMSVTLAASSFAQQSVQQANYRPGGDTTRAQLAATLGQPKGGVELASCDSCTIDGLGGEYSEYGDASYGCDIGCSDSCGAGGCGIKGMLGGVCGGNGNRFFVGGEYLHVRANPSEAVSYLERDLTDITSPTDTFNQFDFDYEGSFRLYGGCRNCCGEEIRFTYTRFDTGSGFVSPTVPNGSGGAFQIVSPLEVVATIDGSRTEGSADIELNSFDLGWSKTIPLGSPLGCDTGCGDACLDGCCDPCCDSWCPAWDITFTGAFRTADLSAQRNFVSYDVSNVAQTTGRTAFDFDGAGARVGLLGRRYFGRNGIASLYLKGDLSLLVGEYSTEQQRASAATPNQITGQSISCRHIIPVTEIEAGGTVFVTCNTSLSGGYFMSAWHDLGFRDEYDFGLQTTYDDANIMGFDGFFVRMETAF